jgi:precorrin-2/cobalt-factor-2 C20-methyltransferase
MSAVLYGIGVGPGDPDLLTIKAVKILQQVDVVAVPESSSENGSTALDIALPHLNKEAVVLNLEFPMVADVNKRELSRQTNARLLADYVRNGKKVAFLTLGDPLLYSTFQYILRYVSQWQIPVKCIPGIYSFAAVANAINLPLVIGNQQLAVLSNLDENKWDAIQLFDKVVCMKVSAYAPLLHQLLNGNNHWQFAMVTNVGKADQQISFDVADLLCGVHYFTTVILTKKD